MGWLDDHRVLVTVAGSGLGRAIVERFVDEGAQVVFEVDPDTGHYVLLASRDNSRTVTGSVHNRDGGVGVRGHKDLEAAIARALTQEG